MTKRVRERASVATPKEALERALLRNTSNAHLALQTAQQHLQRKDFSKALAAFDHRSNLAGLDQEVYASLWLGARIAGQLGHPHPDVIARYLRAFDFRPQRAEAPGDLARYLRESSPRWNLAFLLMQHSIAMPPTNDLVLVEPEWEQWRCQDEFAVAAYWVGNFEACKNSCELLLGGAALPRVQRPRVLENLNYARKKLKLPLVEAFPTGN